MKYKQGSTLEALRRVQGFLDVNTEVFASINTSSARRNLDDAVTRLSTHAAGQEGGARGSRGQTARQRALRSSLRTHQMRAIATVAKQKLRDVPEFDALTMPNPHVSVERLIAAATAMADASSTYEQVLIDAGMPVAFIANLTTAIEAVRQSVDARGTTRGQQVGSTAGLQSEATRGRSIIKMLDSFVLPLVGSNDVLLAGWRVAKRIERKPGPVKPSAESTTSSPVPTTTAPKSVTTAPNVVTTAPNVVTSEPPPNVATIAPKAA